MPDPDLCRLLRVQAETLRRLAAKHDEEAAALRRLAAEVDSTANVIGCAPDAGLLIPPPPPPRG